MAGRGRGKTNGTLTQEQLQSLGVTSKEIQAVTSAAPPPLYPPLLSKPVPLESNADRSYKILWKEDFISYLRESTYYTTKKSSKVSVQRYCDKVINVIENDPKTKREGDFLWKLMPAELKPSFKRLKAVCGTTPTAKRIRSADDINAKLKALEQKESSNDHADVVKKEKSDSEDDKEANSQKWNSLTHSSKYKTGRQFSPTTYRDDDDTRRKMLFVRSSWGRKHLLYDGDTYASNKRVESTNTTYWRCTLSNRRNIRIVCEARCTVRDGQIIKMYGKHSHPPEVMNLRGKQVETEYSIYDP